MPAERLLNLDMLRFVSAMLVVVHHYAFRMQVTGEGGGIGFPELSDIAIWLDTGLLIFFAISGYVITLSSEGRTALEFAIGRFARLWPTFVLCASITAIVLFNWPVPGLPTPTIEQWLAHAIINSRLLGQPFLDGAYWTIAYEIIFYGWVFVFMAMGLFHRFWMRIVLLWLLLSVLNEFILDSEILRKLFITEFSGYFAFGMTLCKIRSHSDYVATCILVSAILLACLTPFLIEPKNFEIYGIYRNNLGLFLVGPISLACVALCTLSSGLSISRDAAMTLGGLTYPIYLLHQNIGYSVFARFGPENGRFLVAALLLVSLVFVSWLIAHYFEPIGREHIKGWAIEKKLIERLPKGRPSDS